MSIQSKICLTTYAQYSFTLTLHVMAGRWYTLCLSRHVENSCLLFSTGSLVSTNEAEPYHLSANKEKNKELKAAESEFCPTSDPFHSDVSQCKSHWNSSLQLALMLDPHSFETTWKGLRLDLSLRFTTRLFFYIVFYSLFWRMLNRNLKKHLFVASCFQSAHFKPEYYSKLFKHLKASLTTNDLW